MVNELTQALAQIGCEVYIISPYYNYNRKGKTGYLKEEGITFHFRSWLKSGRNRIRGQHSNSCGF